MAFGLRTLRKTLQQLPLSTKFYSKPEMIAHYIQKGRLLANIFKARRFFAKLG